MERQHWLGRNRMARLMARDAICSAARLAHLELAGRYDLKAAVAKGGPLFVEEVRP